MRVQGAAIVLLLAFIHAVVAAPTLTVTLTPVDGSPLKIKYVMKATGGAAVVPVFLTPFAEEDDVVALPRSDAPLMVKATSSAAMGVASIGHWAGMVAKRLPIHDLPAEEDLMLEIADNAEKSVVLDLAVAYRFYASTTYHVSVNPELASLRTEDCPPHLVESGKWPASITVPGPLTITVPGGVAKVKPSFDLGDLEALLAQASIDSDVPDPGDMALARFRGTHSRQQSLDPFTRFSAARSGSSASADATPSFDATTCTAQNKKDEILAAFKHAKTMAAKAVKESNPKGGNDNHFRLWFGTHGSGSGADLTSHEGVLKNFEAIYRAIRPATGTTSQVEFFCSSAKCKASTYAFVYGADPYKVYLCPQFWKAAKELYKADSQPGTIIHELSHFDVLAGTDDHAYGRTKAKALAKSNAVRARDNADNNEYFAEQQK